MTQIDNKRVAKNAIALTFRMVLVTIVGLFTSRIVLQALGVDDYGIYGVIGGVVGMVSFLNTSMAGATSRFITFELGRGNEDKLQKIFSTSLIIHIIIAVVVALLAETIGLWFVNNKMNFPPGRMFAVNVLYQFTILSMMVSFTQVPYSAAIIAHEKMNIYAYFEIVNVVLKLAIVYLLLVVSGDRLILYGGLMLLVSVLSAVFYRWYCIRNFKETYFSTRFDKQTAKEMMSFSIFDLYGNLCISFKYQGQPLVLNIFFGVVANAASTITSTVSSVILGLTINVFSAFRPQIIKKYALGRIQEMQGNMRMALQFTIFFFGIIAIPVIMNASQVMYIWLGQIPEYSVEFVRIVLLGNFLTIIIQVNTAAIHATGKIKLKSFLSGTFYLLSLALAYYFLKKGTAAYYVYIADVCMMNCVVITGLLIIKYQMRNFEMRKYCLIVIRSLIPVVLTVILGIVINRYDLLPNVSMNNVNGGFILNICLSFLVLNVCFVILTFIIAFGKNERHLIMSNLIRIIKKLFPGKIAKSY
ncbi:MAG: polysaccharide biosynthesis protein [Muribaculaceae bacterium]|nr:polysaccharide biosynthesis protein [Muribaculaceae bacterium]